MRPIRFGMIAALALALAAPASVMTAAPKKDLAAELIAAQQREKGQADAPGLISAANLPCEMTDARWMGADKKMGIDIYEVTCKQGIGFVILNKIKEDGTPPQTFTCLETARPLPDGSISSLKCTLPGSNDVQAALAPLVAKGGRSCVIDKARAIGQSEKSAYFEVACQDGAGFIMVTSNPPDATQEVQMNTCLIYQEGANLFCELTDRTSQLRAVDALVAKSGKPCTITDRRYVLTSKNGENYYEVACQEEKGYMVGETASGEFVRVIDCGAADFVGGGCTLTDSRAAKTEQTALYTRLAKQSGFNCDVERYAPLPTTGSNEVVELQCSNRPDGGIATFVGQGGRVQNCVLAELDGYRCAFSERSAVYPKLTADLRAFGKSECQVSDTRMFGNTATGGFIEVACSDGLPGWVIGYPSDSDKPKEVLSCTQAASFGTGGCKLPTNKR